MPGRTVLSVSDWQSRGDSLILPDPISNQGKWPVAALPEMNRRKRRVLSGFVNHAEAKDPQRNPEEIQSHGER